jgi:hypothetical protein
MNHIRFIINTSPRLEAGTRESGCAAILPLRVDNFGCASTIG